VVHGEEQSAVSLSEAFKEMGLHDVTVPEYGQVFQL
jgi:hypothetical protein